jgi:ribosome biogenesis ATPase
MADFSKAVKKVQPSAKREGFATIPDVCWADIGALQNLKEQLEMSILQPIVNPGQFEAIGLTVPAGVLLYGPPGCGKTLVAKAIANESGASFLSIKGPELLNQYVGQSERAVRQVFQRARASSPCVIFFDELDALCPKRGRNEGSVVSERVVNHLLTEMDGLDDRKQVFVIAATNRPDIIDPAMLRPGRLDKLLYVPLPQPEDRHAILKIHTKKTPLAPEVDLKAIALSPNCNGYSGADLAAFAREATVLALREYQLQSKSMPQDSKSVRDAVKVTVKHFEAAYRTVHPSVSAATVRKYDRMSDKLRKARSTIAEAPADGVNTTTAPVLDPNSLE